MSKKSTQAYDILKLKSHWPYQIIVLADRITRLTSQIVKVQGLNLSQWRVLAAIAEEPGRTSVDVVKITPMDKGIVSRATKTLLHMGFVRRHASQYDGRLSHLHLTESGALVYQVLQPQVQAILQRADGSLSITAQEELSKALKTLIQVIPDLR
jgi:DNA-binding MarR family transcriptional regulator